MATNQEFVSSDHEPGEISILSNEGFDVSNTTVYHPSGGEMRRLDIATLECPKCTKILREPVQLITCGCRFCAVCIDSMLANERYVYTYSYFSGVVTTTCSDHNYIFP